MQDVCVSFWRGDGIFTDMMLKVTDVCPTDPADPTACESPMDIKVDRDKVRTLFHLKDAPTGDVFEKYVYWMFTKCWADVSSLFSFFIHSAALCYLQTRIPVTDVEICRAWCRMRTSKTIGSRNRSTIALWIGRSRSRRRSTITTRRAILRMASPRIQSASKIISMSIL